ncbi:MAG TPA: hypothetical protein VGI45_18870 [Terracidiphilus sp.]|jgi:hypothetical protein
MALRHTLYHPMMLKWLVIVALVGLGLVSVVAVMILLSLIGGPGGAGWKLYPTILRSRRAMRRVLKERGFAIFQSPVSEQPASTHDIFTFA